MANWGTALGGAGTGAAIGTAFMPGVGTAIGAGLGGLAGYFAGSDKSDEVAELERQAMEAMKNVDIPTLQALTPILTQYHNAGLLSPTMEATFTDPDSLMSKVAADPRLKDAQMSALNRLTDQSHGGLNMSDRAALDQVMRNSNVAEHSNEQQILQDMQQRGQAGSGAELAARLSSAQNAANTRSAQGLQVGATATQRALEALANSGNMATQMRTQDVGEQSDKARAQDVINQFNTANRQAVASRNNAATNNANEYNVRNAQDVANRNTGVSNDQARANAAAAQQNYSNKVGKATGISQAANNYAGQLEHQQDRTNQTVGSTISGVAGAGMTIADLIKKMGANGGGASGGNGGGVPGYGSTPNMG